MSTAPSPLQMIGDWWNNYIGSTLFGQVTNTGNTNWGTNPNLPSIDIKGIIAGLMPIIIPIGIVIIILFIAYMFIKKVGFNLIRGLFDGD